MIIKTNRLEDFFTEIEDIYSPHLVRKIEVKTEFEHTFLNWSKDLNSKLMPLVKFYEVGRIEILEYLFKYSEEAGVNLEDVRQEISNILKELN